MNAELYRLRAEQCRDLASNCADAEKRKVWLTLAAQWDRLACQIDCRSDPDFVHIAPPPIAPMHLGGQTIT